MKRRGTLAPLGWEAVWWPEGPLTVASQRSESQNGEGGAICWEETRTWLRTTHLAEAQLPPCCAEVFHAFL